MQNEICALKIREEYFLSKYQEYCGDSGSKWKEKTENDTGMKMLREFTRQPQIFPRM